MPWNCLELTLTLKVGSETRTHVSSLAWSLRNLKPWSIRNQRPWSVRNQQPWRLDHPGTCPMCDKYIVHVYITR